VIGEGAGRGGNRARSDARGGEQRNAARGDGSSQRGDRPRSDAAPRRDGRRSNASNGHARLLGPKR